MSERITEELFRRQAIKALSKRPFGRPIATMPRPWSWLTCLIVVFALACSVFLSVAEYSRKEKVRGWLVATGGVARISHDANGVVEGIAAKLGEPVAAGDPLIYLSRDIFLESGRSTADELISEFTKQSAAIDRRIVLLRHEADIGQRSIVVQLQSLEEERQAIVRRRSEQKRRLETASDKLSRLQSLVGHGAVSEWEILQQKDEHAVLTQAMEQLEQNDIVLKRETERLEVRARSLPIETERSIAELNSQRSRLRQQITEYDSRRRVVLKSPITGKLASLEVHQGAAVAPNQLLATVIPEQLSLAAEVYVPSSAIGFIKKGQAVRLVYDAFPQQQFGAFAGEVDHISEFILLPSEVPQTFFPREATFKIRIAIEHDSVALERGGALLRPGMLLAAEIVLETRRLVDWLLEPIQLRRKRAA